MKTPKRTRNISTPSDSLEKYGWYARHYSLTTKKRGVIYAEFETVHVLALKLATSLCQTFFF